MPAPAPGRSRQDWNKFITREMAAAAREYNETQYVKEIIDGMPPRRNRFESMAKVLNQRDVEFVQKKLSRREARRHKWEQLSVFVLYVQNLNTELRVEHQKTLEEAKKAGPIDAWYFRSRQLQRHRLIGHLYVSGWAYMLNTRLGGAMMKSAMTSVQNFTSHLSDASLAS